MDTEYYLSYIANNIHTTVAATVDENNLPVTCALDIMDSDSSGLYFLTARGKNFYNRLIRTGYIALTAIQGKDTMSSVAVSVRGEVCELGYELIPRLFAKNQYMEKIYPTEDSRKALSVFKIYRGTGEWFDLSKKPIERLGFSFGTGITLLPRSGYHITQQCTGCGLCINICPQQCIILKDGYAVIKQENCLHCGSCYENCRHNAVEKLQ